MIKSFNKFENIPVDRKITILVYSEQELMQNVGFFVCVAAILELRWPPNDVKMLQTDSSTSKT